MVLGFGKETSQRQPIPIRAVALGLVVVHFIFDLKMPAVFALDAGARISPFMLAALSFSAIGIAISQINLIAIVAAFSQGKLIVRLPIAVVLGTTMWAAIVIGNQWSYGLDGDGIITLGLLIASGIVVASLPLIFMATKLGWRLVGPTGSAGDDDRRFDLWQLLVAMALIAGSMGLGIRLLPKGEVLRLLPGWGLYSMFGIAAVSNLLLVVPALFFAFASNWLKQGLIWIVMTVLVAFPVGFGINSLSGPIPFGTLAAALGIVTESLALIVSLAVLRMFGCRLVREVRTDIRTAQ